MIPPDIFFAFIALLILLVMPFIAPVGKKIKLFILSLIGILFTPTLTSFLIEKIYVYKGETDQTNDDLTLGIMIVYVLLAVGFVIYIRNKKAKNCLYLNLNLANNRG